MFNKAEFDRILDGPDPECPVCGLRMAYTGEQYYCAEDDLHPDDEPAECPNCGTDVPFRGACECTVRD